MSNDQLSKITDFFRPNRLVWQEVEEYGSSNADADSDTDVDTDTDIERRESTDDFAQVMQIIKQAKNECDTSKKAICSLNEDGNWNLEKANRLRKFIDELDYKFFVKGEGEDKLGSTSERLKRLEGQLNMEKIIKEFLKTKAKGGYEIVVNDPVINDHIVFHYKDGSTKRIFLEMSLKPPKLFSAEGQNEGIVAQIEEAVGEEGISDFLNKNLSKIREMKEKTENRTKRLIDHSKDLNTPDLAYAELERIVPDLPEDLRNDLSEPLSKIADIWSNATLGENGVENMSGVAYTLAVREVTKTISEYYGVENMQDIKDLDPDAWSDFLVIGETFGVE